MLEVNIEINKREIVSRKVVNQGEKDVDGRTKYLVDGEEVIWHRREDGAVELAQKVLAITEEPE